MRRWIAVLLVLFILPVRAGASEPFTVEAKAAVLIDAASGRVLFGQNENEQLPMASTTKIMTALLALENCSTDEKVTAGKNAHGVEGTSIYLSEGETLSMEHMLYGLMLRSGNDAAVAIAEHVAGSVPEFAGMMNRRAEELGADAHFVNPHGLPADGHRASALGLARIMRQAMTIPEFRTITGTTKKIIPWVGNEYSRVLENKNRLLTSYEGADGGKTGYTKAAGRCLVFSAGRGDLSLIGTVLGCPTWFDTAETLLDYGFEHFRAETVFRKDEPVGSIQVHGGSQRTVTVVSGSALSSALPANANFTVQYDYRKNLTAPIHKGEVLGMAYMRSGGEIIASTPLIAAEDIGEWNFIESLKNVLRRWLLQLEEA